MGVAYIGAGEDFKVVDIFKDEPIFVLVDSMPRSSWGFARNDKLSDKNFIKRISKKLETKGFKKASHIKSLYKVEKAPFITPKYFNPGLIIYTDGTRLLYYFYSCAYPDFRNNTLHQLLSICDKLYISGHEPGDNVILRMKKPIYFIGSSDTVYDPDVTEPDSLFYQMVHWDNIKELVKDFYLFDAVEETLSKRDMDYFFDS